MDMLDKMMASINSIYRRYLDTDRGEQYALARLWEDYYDEDPDEEMIIYNMIIAKINLEQQTITSNNWKCISRAIEYYEKNKEKVEIVYSKKDLSNHFKELMMEYRKRNHVSSEDLQNLLE